MVDEPDKKEAKSHVDVRAPEVESATATAVGQDTADDEPEEDIFSRPGPAKTKSPPPEARPTSGFVVFLRMSILAIVLVWMFVIGILVGRGTIFKEQVRSTPPQPAPAAARPAEAAPPEPGEEPTLLARMPGRKSVIIISNFRSDKVFGDPGADAAAIGERFGDLAIYTVSFSTDEDGRRRARNLARSSRCGRYFDGAGVFDDPNRFQSLVKEVFVGSRYDQDLDGVCDDADKCPDTPRGTPVDDDGCPVPVTMTLNIEFPSGKSDVRPEYRDIIGKVARHLKDLPLTKATIEGYTDAQGDGEQNLRLSQMRADSIKDYLVKEFQIAPDRLKAVGFGEANPIADNETAEGRQKNRRVDVFIAGDFKT